MKVLLYPKNLLEELWKEEKRQFSSDAKYPLICLRCGNKMYPPITNNRFSLFAKVNICPYCTSEEFAQEEMRSDKHMPFAPLAEWHAVTSGRLKTLLQKKKPVLHPSCSFNEIFEGIKKTVHGLERPVSEELFLRAYYLNGQWTNLYSEIEHYLIWLRLIIRPQDYNLYVHFYLK